MLAHRLIVCLDVSGNRVVKGVTFADLRDVGDPVSLAERYARLGADEIVFLDVAATIEERAGMLETLRRAAETIFVPLTFGGGIRDSDDMGAALRAGADKVSVNSAAVARPALIEECASRFGAQCVVASIDARRTEAGGWEVVTHGGRRSTGLDAVQWAGRCAALGAGEILLTSIDCDGARDGYDVALTSAVSRSVTVPVIASGGAGSAEHLADAIRAGADAALVAGILHDGSTTIARLKEHLGVSGFPIRVADDGRIQ